MNLTEAIKGLEDDIAEERKRSQEAAREEKKQTQIYRAVTTVTERQADLLLGVLNTISAYVRSILDIMQGTYQTAGSVAAGAGSVVNFYGGIHQTINAPVTREGGRELAESFRAEVRAAGIKV